MSNNSKLYILTSLCLASLLLMPFSITQKQAYSKTHSSVLTKTQNVIPISEAIIDNPNPAPAAAKNITGCDSLLLQNIADKSPVSQLMEQ